MVASNLSYWRVGNPGERCLGESLLDEAEVLRVLGHLPGLFRLVGELMLATGLRLEDLLQVRVRDVVGQRGELAVRDHGGTIRRHVRLDARLSAAVCDQVEQVRRLFEADQSAGGFGSALPRGFEDRYPLAGQRWCLQFLFPSSRVIRDGMTGRWCRPHLETSAVQEALAVAGRAAGLQHAVQTHALRHAYAARLLKDGVPMEVMRNLMGHANRSTTEQYVQVLKTAMEGRVLRDASERAVPARSSTTARRAMPLHQVSWPLWNRLAQDVGHAGAA